MLGEALLREAFDQNTKTRTQKKEVQCGLLPIAIQEKKRFKKKGGMSSP